MRMIRVSLCGRLAVCLLLLSGGYGCASDTSYDRHNLSRLWVSQDGTQLYFDATVSADYPVDSQDAEEIRSGWITDWLKRRSFCAEGHRVGERRLIRKDEYNPQRHNLRYEIECL